MIGISAVGAGLVFAPLSSSGKILTEMYAPIPESFEYATWVKIDPDGTTTITVNRSEMGQGVRTSLAMILADAMDADWSKVKIRQARPDMAKNSITKLTLETSGSDSITANYGDYLGFGSYMRTVFMTAAAKKWNIDKSLCLISNGRVSEKDGTRSLLYGELIADILASPPTIDEVIYKTPSEFKLIGTPQPHIDNPDIVSGKAIYGLDVRIPGMKFAVMLFSPAIGYTMKSFDAAESLKIPGVLKVEEVPKVGVVVLAENSYAALKGREALKVEWNSQDNSKHDTDLHREQMKNAITMTTVIPDTAVTKIEAHYELPYLAHATLEPMNSVADVRENSAEIWSPTQNAASILKAVAKATSIPEDNIIVNTTLIGGAFGSRLTSHYAEYAARISQYFKVPVMFMYSGKDTIQQDSFRQATYHVCKAGIDANGALIRWARQSVYSTLFYDPRDELPYTYIIPKSAYVVSNYVSVYGPAATGIWRSVVNASDTFVTESFIDELAVAAGKDPFDYKRALLRTSMHKTVLEVAAEKSEWTKPLPKGWGRGIASMAYTVPLHGELSFIAQVVEVSVSDAGILKVERVVAVVYCGLVINPMGVEAQIQGAIVDGLSTALKSEITVKNGAVQQSSFRDFEWLRINEMPKIEVHFIPSTEYPKGVGEIGFPTVSPALCNAIFNATGVRVRRLPIQKTPLTVDESQPDIHLGELRVFPSPFTDRFTIEGQFHSPKGSELTVSIINILGSTLLTVPSQLNSDGSFSQEIEFPGRASGMYFVRINNGAVELSRTIIKE